MRFKILLGLLTITSSFIYGQEVIGSEGATFSNGAGSLSFTLGEVVISTENSASADLTQGFHQSNLTVTGLTDFFTTIEISVYPNPTQEYVNISTSEFENLEFQLSDISGKLLQIGSTLTKQTSLDLSAYERGTYVLSIQSKESASTIKSYQIIKQ